jgi:hypothetical protein
MKTIKISAALLAALLAGAAQAGDSGAGPAASGGPGVGSIITPGSHELLNTTARDARGKRIEPGNGGSVVLSGEQLVAAIDRLRAFEGAKVTGAVINAPTVLADGTPAVITLNTESGRLVVTRRER